MNPSREQLAGFRCTECGDCCRSHRVPLTIADASRLATATGQPASELIEWLSPDQIDMSGEPESFVVLREGRRLPVLAFRRGACLFLDTDNRCRAYPARPASCRTFPLEVTLVQGKVVRRLDLLPEAGCPGRFDAEPDESAIVARHLSRRAELVEHVGIVAAWNRRQRLRRMAGRRLESVESFIAFAFARPSAR